MRYALLMSRDGSVKLIRVCYDTNVYRLAFIVYYPRTHNYFTYAYVSKRLHLLISNHVTPY
jgi:hypothetical protein